MKLELKVVGLMGIGNDGFLYTPKGKRLIWLPLWLAVPVQKLQHKYALLTWRLEKDETT